jgi:hypothetical protein
MCSEKILELRSLSEIHAAASAAVPVCEPYTTQTLLDETSVILLAQKRISKKLKREAEKTMMPRLVINTVRKLFTPSNPMSLIGTQAYRGFTSVQTTLKSKDSEVSSDASKKEELIRSIMKKLRGPLADEDGNVPTGDDRPVAIEVDGPSHFYVNTTKYTAYTKLKHRLLTRMGYKVLHVPYFEWRKLKGAKARQEYLREKLKEEPTEWLDPEDEKLYADRIKRAEELEANKPPPPKGPRPTRRKLD